MVSASGVADKRWSIH